MNKKILVSLALIGVAAAAIGSTIAFFSDKETSTGNTFVAGSIDLKVGDSAIEVNGPINNTRTWEPTDLTEQKFFDFDDVKPGDNGKDAIKIKVGTNPAWVCAEVKVTEDLENGLTNPETKMQDTEETGELDEELYITFFEDLNCNGKQDEKGDDTLVPWTLFKNVGKFALADATHGSAFQPGVETCISKNWCVGAASTDVETGVVTCDGSQIGNRSQTDKLIADIALEAIQTRHNDNFTCVEPIALPTNP